MARIRKRFVYADYKEELVDFKDARRGASEDEFWPEEELVDHRPRRKRIKVRRRAGCPENNNGAHVYVWVDYISPWSGFKYEEKVCCGCGKHPRRNGFRFKSR